MSYLCNGCKRRADRLAELSDTPDRFKLQIGLASEFEGHADIHQRLKQAYEREFGAVTLDNFLLV